METVGEKIFKARNAYDTYEKYCYEIARYAQELIDWDNYVTCSYYPGDGLCICIGLMVCPVNRFFCLLEEGKGNISRELYEKHCL